MLELVCALFAVVEGSIPGDLVGSCAANLQRGLHLDLEDIAPEGTKVHVVLAADGDPGGIDTIVVIVRRETNRAVVCPAARFHGLGCCYTDL